MKIITAFDEFDCDDKESVAIAKNITMLKEKAIEAVGYIHIGSDIIHTQYNNSDEFSKYQDFGMDIIIDWFMENEPYMY